MTGTANIAPALTGGLVWAGADLPRDAGHLSLGAEALAELEDAGSLLADNPLPILPLDPRDFSLTACRAVMARARALLDGGPGFAILDRLPVEAHGREVATKLYWLLARLLARPVAQKWDGTMVYDVRDMGRPPGNGVRPDITNAEQNFHVDTATTSARRIMSRCFATRSRWRAASPAWSPSTPRTTPCGCAIPICWRGSIAPSSSTASANTRRALR